MEKWSTGVVTRHHSITPSLHHSITPSLHPSRPQPAEPPPGRPAFLHAHAVDLPRAVLVDEAVDTRDDLALGQEEVDWHHGALAVPLHRAEFDPLGIAH